MKKNRSQGESIRSRQGIDLNDISYPAGNSAKQFIQAPIQGIYSYVAVV